MSNNIAGSSRTDPPSAALDSVENRLLAQLPTAVHRSIAGDLEPVRIELGQTLYAAGDSISHIYFPAKSTMVSLLCRTSDGSSVEVGVTGWEGVVGFQPLMGSDATPHQLLCQIPGDALRIEKSSLQKVFQESAEMRDLLLRYVQALMGQISQTALCNRIHPVEERLARWTLVSYDRSDKQQLPLTHEFMARMLGVNRSTVSLTAATLQQSGAIRYSRGKVAVTDRDRLEDIACDCYHIVREQYKNLGIM